MVGWLCPMLKIPKKTRNSVMDMGISEKIRKKKKKRKKKKEKNEKRKKEKCVIRMLSEQLEGSTNGRKG